MTDVFLSYNRGDQATARRFAEALKAHKFHVWWDTALKPGEAYDDVTEKALRTAKAVIVLWSPKSVASRWVRAEATLANRLGTLVPAMIEPCERPILFELIQTADLSNWTGDRQDAAWLNFLADLRTKIDQHEARPAEAPSTGPTQLRAIHFGAFSILPDRHLLMHNGAPVEITPKAFDLLRVLIRERAEPHSRAELLNWISPGERVEEAIVSAHINALRKVLGPNVIKTIPDRGYQFVAQLREQGQRLDAAPQPDAPSQRINNLPETLPRLYGRDKEIAELTDLISTHQMVTICGPGGMGKSSVARAVTALQTSMFEDGVWWIELAPLRSGELILGAIARTLDVSLSSPDDLSELVQNLSDRQILLVLDNCEHLIEAVADVANALLREAPNVRLLATSQEIIKLSEEHVYRLQPLEVPDEDSLAAEVDSGALALFEVRAQAAQPEFKLTPDNRMVVADICKQLDGLPLAIELAAARLPLLGLDGLRQRLSDRFRLLANSSRTAPSRQRTLRAALEWSYGLLTPQEQTIFARLSVFSGGFDLDIAEQVCTDDELQSWDVLDHVSALVDKSLLSSDLGEPPRYRLLDTPRSFAQEQLKAGADARNIFQRHADCMYERLLQAQKGEWERDGSAIIDRLVTDLDNLRAALTWAAGDDGDADRLINLAGTGSIVWRSAKAEGEGLAWSEKAMDVICKTTDANAEAELLVSFAIMSHQRDADREISSLIRATELFRRLENRQKLYFALGALAKKQIWRRDLEAAEAAIDEAEVLFNSAWPPAVREPVLQARTYLLEILGRPEEGEPLMLELVDIMRAVNDPHRIDMALLELAESYIVQGKLDAAVSVHREVCMRTQKRGAPYISANLGNLAAALTQLGELDEAVKVARLAIPLLHRQRKLIVFLDHFALLACRLGNARVGALVCGRADAEMATTGFQREVSETIARELVQKELDAAFDAATVLKLQTEGVSMTNEHAAKLAIEE